MTDKQPFLKKNIICSKLNLDSKTLGIIESLYLELIIKGEFIKNEENYSSENAENQIKSIMNVLEWKLQNEISEDEFSILYREWVKSKFIKEPIHIKYQETFTRDEFFNYIVNLNTNLDADFTHIISYFLNLVHGEYNSIINEEKFLGFGDNNEKISNVKKSQIEDLDNLFNIFDDEGVGYLSFDKIFYLFLVLYVSSIDVEETCDLFFIKREFQKFLIDIKEIQGKLTLRQFKNYFIQKQLLLKKFLQKVSENSITFAKILNFFILKAQNSPPQSNFPNILDICFIKAINSTKIIDIFYEENIKIETIRTKHPNLNAYYLFLQEIFFRDADFLKLFDKNRMPYKLRFYSNALKNFTNYFSSNFLKAYNISFSEEFFTVFSQHIEQIFDDIFQIYKKYFHEIDAMDFDNFFKPNTNKYLNKEILEDKSSILPYKIHANYNRSIIKTNGDENHIKKIPIKSNFKSDLEESLDNLSNENKDNYKIKIINADSTNKSNGLPKSKNFDNLFDTERNTSNETQNKSIETNNKNWNNTKNASFYSYPQSKDQNNKKINSENYSCNNFESLGNKNKTEDFVMRNVQKIQKLYSNNPYKNSKEFHNNNKFVESKTNEDLRKKLEKNKEIEENTEIKYYQKEKENINVNYLPNQINDKFQQNKKYDIMNKEKSFHVNQLSLDLSNFQKNTEKTNYSITERTPVKRENYLSRPKNQPNNNSRLNSTETNNKSKIMTTRTDKHSVSPSFYYHKLETFETVMTRLNKKGCSAEKPRKPFH